MFIYKAVSPSAKLSVASHFSFSIMSEYKDDKWTDLQVCERNEEFISPLYEKIWLFYFTVSISEVPERILVHTYLLTLIPLPSYLTNFRVFKLLSLLPVALLHSHLAGHRNDTPLLTIATILNVVMPEEHVCTRSYTLFLNLIFNLLFIFIIVNWSLNYYQKCLIIYFGFTLKFASKSHSLKVVLANTRTWAVEQARNTDNYC